ncbi:MAG: 3-oxoacyl-[acyl-carrier-protein] synthase 3 [Candidatus Xenolissoclinum pacificiensis L6]|uniref:Beta-ketoacyl-[acyl-carrier-protein] synthase III n=1 Tax=Candidatus Xenolissoclinum pacificiensis L6 TaxID=1401685 RepID=W2UYU2_9RICK|nr:MAG: 3-oxoacyl-[acyl-carrier-protein] synthase 3 [Candidatus Xenolissoclinum pacificiensis L6]
MPNSIPIAIGSFLPENTINNDYFSGFLDTSDEWITQRTGIKQRQYVTGGMKTSDMCIRAAQVALESINFDPRRIDAVIVATSTADSLFPGCSHITQKSINACNAFAFDMQVACSGFIYAISVADQYIKTGYIKHALIIGADSMSKILNYQDRTTCTLFGDGAGAILLSNIDDEDQGIISTSVFSNGELSGILSTKGGLFSEEKSYICMEGRKVFECAINYVSETIVNTFKEHNVSYDHLPWIVVHQANKRIIDAIALKTNIPKSKFLVTVDKHANTSAASIPLALDYYIARGDISSDNSILTVGFGAGFTWGAVLIKNSLFGNQNS